VDNLSYRNSRTAQRSSSEQREVPARSPEPVSSAPSPPAVSKTSRGSAPDEKPGKKKKFIGLIIGAIVILVVLGLVTAFVRNASSSDDVAIDSKKYQAVFFTNGQVYFGKLTSLNQSYLKLTDIFYLQSESTTDDDSKNPQNAASNSQGDVQLIKLGDEVHGPDDEMIISRDQVMFYENLKTDGKVSQSISKYNKR